MISDNDVFDKGSGTNKYLVEELAIANLLNIITNPNLNDCVDREDLKTIKKYLKSYVKNSSKKLSKRLEYENNNYSN